MLAQQFRDAYPVALATHNLTIANIIQDCNGFLFKVIGDSHCAAFRESIDAVKASYEIQKKNSNPANEPVLKVKIGIHKGEAEWTGEDYSAYMTLSRTQRIMSIASGGQVIFSKNVLDTAKDSFPSDLDYNDLGRRSLKDFTYPINLFELTGDDIQSDFPPLNSIDVRPNNIPVSSTAFIGREKELKEIRDNLDNNRLITLIGIGGTGKTRLALQAAFELIDQFENGVWFIELAALRDSESILQTILSVFKIPTEAGNPMDALFGFLKEKELLIVIDNCEHLISGSAAIAEAILTSCPKVKIIATTREPLRIMGEIILNISALSFPEETQKITPDSLMDYEAVKLFVNRAIAVKNDFKVNDSIASLIAEICIKLDGIPLAIELAAARIKVLSAETILEKLSKRFSFLTAGNRSSLPRQQTLRALIDWSYDLLNEKEKLLIERLSVFAGEWTLEAAENVCSDEKISEDEILDLLGNLCDKSLVRTRYYGDSPRYGMLETIREYTSEKLVDKEIMRRKHYDYFYRLSEKLRLNFYEIGMKEGLKILNDEKNNFISAINWSLENDPDLAVSLAVNYGMNWEYRAIFEEALRYYDRILEKAVEKPTEKYTMLLNNAGYAAICTGNYDYAEEKLQKGEKLLSNVNDPDSLVSICNTKGLLYYYTNDLENAQKYFENSIEISKKNNIESGVANSSVNLAAVIILKGDLEKAHQLYSIGLDFYKKEKSILSYARALANLGALEYKKENYDKAIELYNDCKAIFQELEDHEGLAVTLLNLGNANLEKSEFDKAEYFYREALEIADEYGLKPIILHLKLRIAELETSRGNHENAEASLISFIKNHSDSGEYHKIGNAYKSLCKTFFALKKYEQSALMLSLSDKNYQEIGLKLTQKRADERNELEAKLRENLGNENFETIFNNAQSLKYPEIIELITK